MEIASFDSYDDELNNISDCPLNHYVTLGVLQADVSHCACLNNPQNRIL